METKISIPRDGWGIDQLKAFQNHFKDYKLTVYEHGTKGKKIIYEGVPNEKKINLLYYKKHYNVITSLTAAFCCSYYCESCHIAYNTKSQYHKCNKLCSQCQHYPVCPETKMSKECLECNRSFKGNTCYDNHKRFNVKSSTH